MKYITLQDLNPQEHADRDIINKLTKFINEGASYTETAPTAILEL